MAYLLASTVRLPTPRLAAFSFGGSIIRRVAKRDHPTRRATRKQLQDVELMRGPPPLAMVDAASVASPGGRPNVASQRSGPHDIKYKTPRRCVWLGSVCQRERVQYLGVCRSLSRHRSTGGKMPPAAPGHTRLNIHDASQACGPVCLPIRACTGWGFVFDPSVRSFDRRPNAASQRSGPHAIKYKTCRRCVARLRSPMHACTVS